MDYVSVKNLGKYQHYSKRNPPWIKLHREFLHDYTLRQMSPSTRLTFACCLLLASETDNHIPLDYRWLSDRIGIPVTPRTLAPLLSSSLLSLSSVSVSVSDSVPHTDASTVLASSASTTGRPGQGKRAIQESDKPTDKHFNLAKQLGIDLGPEWGKFKNYCLAHDKRYADFEAAFRNWLVRAAESKGGPYGLRPL